ncbi:protein IQ-DOMAIN 14-like [Benincasa hispida]|uniref:protein IQ-DOMAIN 14-like n=1 Tax=Benincasa hispida TaxID=102211 RepID=UPI001900AA94|nr:protein IQ-DOMAIN 14-like [Benincasa hispida]
MGKKGSWIAAIRRAFTPNSKEKPGNEFEKRNKKEKNKGVGKLRHGESNNSFIPLFREPSSVEKIFLDLEREQQRVTLRPASSSPPTPPFVTPRNASPRISSARQPSPPVSPPRVANRPKGFRFRPEPTLRNHHASATKIQAAYRGYVARRSFRALKGLVRLQGVVRGQNVKRQTMNAMKQMQLLVRVQSQIQSRRIQMLDTQPLHHGPNHKDIDTALAKLSFTQASEAGNQEDWDDSLLTREEIEARLQRKAEAIVKRERAMAYAYSHQLWKASPNSTQAVMTDIRSAGFPWWWNWLERQLPSSNNLPNSEPQTLKNFLLAPQTPQQNQTLNPNNNKHHLHNNIDHHQPTLTPKSTKPTILLATATKPSRTSPNTFRTPPATSRSFSKARGDSSPFDVGIKDDESLTSCPPFTVPHYMAPTVSAKAKLRGCSTPTPISTHSKTRISFPFKWNKPNLLFSKDSSANNNSQRVLDNNYNQSVGNLSVDSSVSLPAGVGRKPFNRFV